MRLNISRMDSKGRVLIPYNLRDMFELDIGDELKISTNENKEIVAVPISRDVSKSLVKINKQLEKDGINILDSQIQVMKDKFEWSILADTYDRKNLRKLKKKLSMIQNVKDIKIDNK